MLNQFYSNQIIQLWSFQRW